MLDIEIIDVDGNRTQHRLDSGHYRLGKSDECEIPLSDPFVSRHHADLIVTEQCARLQDVGSTNGILHAGQRIDGTVDLVAGDGFQLGGLTLRVLHCANDDLLDVALTSVGEPVSKIAAPEAQETTDKAGAGSEDIQVFKRTVHQRVLEYLDLHRRTVIHTLSAEALRKEAANTARDVIVRDNLALPAGYSEAQVIEEIIAEAIGLGPIEPLLEDDSVTEVMINGPDRIYLERAGKIELTPARFNSTGSLMSTIERIVTPLGRRIDEGSPMVDARLADGSRVNAIIPPLSLSGPVVTIRKFARRRFVIEDFVANGTLSQEMAEFLEVCVVQRRNIVVSGGTGSGKTTTLNVISNFIPASERIVTIEDAAELQLVQEHLVSLEARPANIEGRGHVAIRDLVRNALRMRPDRIVVGECRGGEALDMLQAMNTGHDGSLTTGHANSPRDLLSRLEVMVLMAGMDLPVRAIREQIASAVNVILQQTRFSDGKRRVTSIVEVDGMEGDTILLQPLFEYRQSGRTADGGIVGDFRGMGYPPHFYVELESAGVDLQRDIFGEPQGLPEERAQWEKADA